MIAVETSGETLKGECSSVGREKDRDAARRRRTPLGEATPDSVG
jgi:hypothetical protein